MKILDMKTSTATIVMICVGAIVANLIIFAACIAIALYTWKAFMG